MTSCLITCAVCLTAALPAWASHTNTEQSNRPDARVDLPVNDPIGKRADGVLATRTIEVNIKETKDGYMLFEPDAISINHGSVVRFIVKNDGALNHEFFLGSFDEVVKHHQWMLKHPDMGHNDPNGISIQSGKTVELVWEFSEMTNLQFGCLIPGHLEAGMWGVIMVHDHIAPKQKG